MNDLPIIEAEKKIQEAQLEDEMHDDKLAPSSDVAGGRPTNIAYPAELSAMTNPPSMETLLQGIELEQLELQATLWQAVKRDWRVIAACFPYFLLACSAGFDQGANNITGSMPSFLLKFGYFDIVNKTLAVESVWVSLWQACLYLGYMLGSAGCSYLLERFGPRKVAMAAAVYINGPILIQAFSSTKAMLLAGKLLCGVGIGAFQVCASNFAAEAAPAKLRSFLTSSIGMALILGLVFGIASGAAVIIDLREWHAFRLVLVLQAILPIAALILLPFSATSPIYLIKRNKPEEAAKVVRRITGIKDTQILAAKVAVMQYAVAKELEERAAHGEVTIWDVLKDKVERRRTLLTIGVFTATQAAGTAFLGQGLYFLVQQGVDVTTATDITLACLTIAALLFPVASILANRFGRRFCFVNMSLLHLAVMLAIGFIGFAKGNKQAGWALAVLVNMGVSTQSLSSSAVVYTLVGEIPSLRLRAKTQSIAFTFNNLISLATTLVVPYIFQSPGYLGAKTALIFSGTLVLAIVWSFFYVPETNKRSPSELDAMFHAGLPARTFASCDVKAIFMAQHQSVTHTV